MLEKLVKALKDSINTEKPNTTAMSVQMSEEKPQPLNATSQKILSLIANQPSITISQLADDLGVNPRTIERNIKVLQENGLLIRVGAKKGGYWRIR
ncbi:HTH domain-containing protein [Xenorhabdus anantnagensis]|uniref:HTH domain-containing protein n=1 Tax=Xenorhabdus anantnagensis TaxID=3025875 RepID=A0ABT5LRH8_9GAMM|nr:HTH domain-containing protein [Xenorhabdus anantnagensis]MDC9596920.1 HTH domain-containing protein [Xenorhabdus anantnagensis]